MHAGQFETLTSVVQFYNNPPGHAVPLVDGLIFNWHLVDPQLSDAEVLDLVAFLRTLTDETALPQIPRQLPSGLPIARLE